MSMMPRPISTVFPARDAAADVLHVDVQQPVGDLLGGLAGIHAGAHGVADVDAQPDAGVQVLIFS